MKEDMYDDWLSDNINQLKEDFCEEKDDEFNKFCRDEFIEWSENR
jgi:hypothetical protein